MMFAIGQKNVYTCPIYFNALVETKHVRITSHYKLIEYVAADDGVISFSVRHRDVCLIVDSM